MKERDLRRLFSGRLREMRELAGLTQAELAEKAGLHPSAVSHFENSSRTPNLENLRNLCVALGGSANYLLGLNGRDF